MDQPTMTFSVLIEAHNVLVQVEDQVRRSGFQHTFRLEVEDAADAMSQALRAAPLVCVELIKLGMPSKPVNGLRRQRRPRIELRSKGENTRHTLKLQQSTYT